MTKEEAQKILCEYLALDSDVNSEFLDAIRTIIQPQDNNFDRYRKEGDEDV